MIQSLSWTTQEGLTHRQNSGLYLTSTTAVLKISSGVISHVRDAYVDTKLTEFVVDVSNYRNPYHARSKCCTSVTLKVLELKIGLVIVRTWPPAISEKIGHAIGTRNNAFQIISCLFNYFPKSFWSLMPVFPQRVWQCLVMGSVETEKGHLLGTSTAKKLKKRRSN